MPKRRLTGIVKSSKGEKTIQVLVESKVKHKRYNKIINRSKTFAAHDNENTAAEGDKVLIEESSPISKTKKWALIDVLERAL